VEVERARGATAAEARDATEGREADAARLRWRGRRRALCGALLEQGAAATFAE